MDKVRKLSNQYKSTRSAHSNPHECYTVFCRSCRRSVQRDHLCYIVCGEPALKYGSKSNPGSKRIKAKVSWADKAQNGILRQVAWMSKLKMGKKFHNNRRLTLRKIPCLISKVDLNATVITIPIWLPLMCLENPDVKLVYRARNCPNLSLHWMFDNTRAVHFSP